MKTKLIQRLLPVAMILTALMTAGCLEQSETIEVRPDGAAAITVELTGDVDNFRDIIARPSAPVWTITRNEIDSVSNKKPQLKFEATADIPYGKPLPHTFAGAAAPDREQQLQFPSEITVRKEGNRTYYEFSRTYRARRYACYNLTGGEFWNQDLEDSVIQQGLFNVSEQDRQSYLEQFRMVWGYLQWRTHWQAMADLVGRGLIPDSIRTSIDSTIYQYFETNITNSLLLTLFKRGDDSLEAAFDSLANVLDKKYESLLTTRLGTGRGEILGAYRESLASVRHDYDITEALGPQTFKIDLSLPGTLLDANGLVDPDEPGKVHWEIKGTELHDHDIPLYARSVVVNR